jgi:hypothetical protein
MYARYLPYFSFFLTSAIRLAPVSSFSTKAAASLT